MCSKLSFKSVFIEFRPGNKSERHLFGRTAWAGNKDVFKVFINTKASGAEQFDTLLHELMHVVVQLSTFEPKMHHNTEERQVRRATAAAKAVLLGSRKP